MASSHTTTVVLDDGAATTAEHWGESGPVMLCVHGMTSSRKSWSRLAKRFAERFRVIAYDQRGHGDSAAVRGPMSLERGVRDLDNVLHAIGGADILVGHSWGGAVVIRGGLEAPVRAVAAIDPMILQLEDAWYDEYLIELEASFALTGSDRDGATRREYAAWHADDVDGKVHAVHAMISEPIARLRSENPLTEWDLREDVKRYSKPLLLAMAARDESVVPEAAMHDIERARNRSVRVVTFDAHGHSLHRTGFEEFASALDTFLEDTVHVPGVS